MITKEKIEELHQRMIHHAVVNDTAIVTLTAKELQTLLNAIDVSKITTTTETDVGTEVASLDTTIPKPYHKSAPTISYDDLVDIRKRLKEIRSNNLLIIESNL